jgi:hypothetical protein
VLNEVIAAPPGAIGAFLLRLLDRSRQADENADAGA